MYIAHQIIQCVQSLHGKGLCHGHLTCDNIGLSSFHSVFLLNILPVPLVGGGAGTGTNSGTGTGKTTSAVGTAGAVASGGNNSNNNNSNGGGSKSTRSSTSAVGGNRAVRPLLIPDDDPSDWIYYFQERNSKTNTSSGVGGADGGNHTSNSGGGSGGSGGGGENDARSASDGSGGIGGGGSGNDANELKSKSKSTMGGEKKCYIAPERFISSSNAGSASASTAATSSSSYSAPPTKLTPAMDIFSLGCVLMELFLNSETAMDLGDLMEYRSIGGNISAHSTLSKKLNKIESGKMRAAVRNMLHLDPAKRLSAGEYLNWLMATTTNAHTDTNTTNTAAQGTGTGKGISTSTSSAAPIPSCHETVFFPLMKCIRCQILSPDARIALAAIYYEKVIYETVGAQDAVGAAYFRNIIGPTTIKLLAYSNCNEKDVQKQGEEKNSKSDIKKDQEEKFEEQMFLQNQTFSFASYRECLTNNTASSGTASTTTPSSDALIVFVQLILSTI